MNLLYYSSMIINISDIKTEALLIFCRDIFASYKDSSLLLEIEPELWGYFQEQNEILLSEINAIIQPNSFYIKGSMAYKNRAIIKYYQHLNNITSSFFKTEQPFNPMLFVISLLTYWFVEYGYEKKSKKYLFFHLFPFVELYDKFLYSVNDTNYKIINITTIDISQKIIEKFNRAII